MSSKSSYINSENIYVYASELAAVIGLNKYKKPAEILLKLWEKNFNDDFKRVKKSLIDNKEEVKLLEKREETFNRISKKVGNVEKLEKKMEECKKENDVEKMKEVRKEMIEHCQDLTTKDKVEIQKAIHEITNTNFGIKNENKSIHIYTQLTNLPVIKLQKFFKRPVVKSNNKIWYIGGKLDGILADNTIIEVKNRVNGLFNTVREYEKIQTYAYMFIFHSQKSQLVETFMKGKNPECNMLDVEYEEEYWNIIMGRLLQFINYFNKFIKSEKMKIKLLTQGHEMMNIEFS